MAAGHEERFRRLYAEEAAARLSRLGLAVMDLEAQQRTGRPATAGVVDAMFRDAHSLKGGAAMVGLPEVAQAAHALEDMLEALRGDLAAVSPEATDALLEALDGLRALIDDAVDSAPAPAAEERDPPGHEPPAGTAGDPPVPLGGDQDVVRLPRARLDALTRLASASASASLRVRQALDHHGGDELLLGEFRQLTLVLEELREQTLRARLVPVASLAPPLARAAHDAARRVGKQMRWEEHGTDAQVDRSVLERLADPLLHLVRNAVDHGLETPEERVAGGKDPAGVVRLAARRRGSEVVVAVSDDGRGIDLDGVRAQAQARGRDTSGLTDAEVGGLVFSSGLSTAGSITELSGRGVGLDIVVAALRPLRGRVEVWSEPGRGTEFRVAVPLTLAVLPCLVVHAGGQSQAIPVHAVEAALPPAPPEGVDPAACREVTDVEGRPLRVSSLGETLGLVRDPAREDPLLPGAPRPAVVVVTDGTRRHGFWVERLSGQRDVALTGLSPLLPRLAAVTGTALQPDGTLLFVLEPAGLLDRAGA